MREVTTHKLFLTLYHGSKNTCNLSVRTFLSFYSIRSSSEGTEESIFLPEKVEIQPTKIILTLPVNRQVTQVKYA